VYEKTSLRGSSIVSSLASDADTTYFEPGVQGIPFAN
jgi:hypothetical protein